MTYVYILCVFEIWMERVLEAIKSWGECLFWRLILVSTTLVSRYFQFISCFIDTTEYKKTLMTLF